MSKLKIDRISLNTVLTEICEHETNGVPFDPINPVLIYNETDGSFTIQSDMMPMHDVEHIISGQLDTIYGMGSFVNDLKPTVVSEFVNSMSDDYIIEHIVGNLTNPHAEELDELYDRLKNMRNAQLHVIFALDYLRDHVVVENQEDVYSVLNKLDDDLEYETGELQARINKTHEKWVTAAEEN